MQALDAGTSSTLPEGLRSELEVMEDSGGVRHLQDLKDQIQARFGFSYKHRWSPMSC